MVLPSRIQNKLTDVARRYGSGDFSRRDVVATVNDEERQGFFSWAAIISPSTTQDISADDIQAR